MPAEARGRCLALLLLLVPATAVQGTPSVPDFSTASFAVNHPGSFARETSLSSGLNNLHEASHTNLARIGREILNRPTEVSPRPALPAGTRSLPGVPAGIFMVLVGFFCISLVNDRKVWLASLAGILWLGQTGLSAIPQAACHIIARKNGAEHSCDGGIIAGSAERHDRLRSDVEGTQYIALLRHLAGIPALISSSMPTSFSSLRTKHSPLCVPGNKAVYERSVQSFSCAMVGYASNQTSPRAWSARAAEHAVRFSPGFVFSNLARGPPQFD